MPSQMLQRCASSLFFSPAKMISNANVSKRQQCNWYIALLYCKAGLKLLRNSTGVILVEM